MFVVGVVLKVFFWLARMRRWRELLTGVASGEEPSDPILQMPSRSEDT